MDKKFCGLFQWESFRSLVRGKSGSKEKSGKVKISAVVVERRRRSVETPNSVPTSTLNRRTDTFMLADYSASSLAEQLCLIEQVEMRVLMFCCTGVCKAPFHSYYIVFNYYVYCDHVADFKKGYYALQQMLRTLSYTSVCLST